MRHDVHLAPHRCDVTRALKTVDDHSQTQQTDDAEEIEQVSRGCERLQRLSDSTGRQHRQAALAGSVGRRRRQAASDSQKDNQHDLEIKMWKYVRRGTIRGSRDENGESERRHSILSSFLLTSEGTNVVTRARTTTTESVAWM